MANMRFRKVLDGYTAQARFLHNRLETKGDEWVIRGYIKLPNGQVKPVYTMKARGNTLALPVVVLQASGREVVVAEVWNESVQPTEEAARALPTPTHI